jgi:8-oxo-dGTP pyrophosphatase MutT (NUDIX family)
VTASALVVDLRSGLLLLHRHRRIGRWLQPGGHIEPAEAPEAAALREVAEETGYLAAHPPAAPSIVHVDEHPGPDGHLHLDLRYLLLVDAAAGPGAAAEDADERTVGPDLRWVHIVGGDGGLEALGADRSLRRAVEALHARVGPLGGRSDAEQP